MPADINIGDNYELDENSNGNLVIRDSTGNGVLEHTDGGGWSINTTADINDLTDSASGNTVYDSSTETFGDGNQNGNFNSVSTDETTIGSYGPFDFIGTDVGEKSVLSVSLPDLSDYHRIKIICPTISTNSVTPVGLVFDGDDASGNYHWQDDDGARNNNQDSLSLFDVTASGVRRYSTTLTCMIHSDPSSSISRLTISQSFGVATNASLSDLGRFMDTGGYDTDAPSQSVEIRNLSGSNTNSMFVLGEQA